MIDLFCDIYQDCRLYGDSTLKSFAIAYIATLGITCVNFLGQLSEQINGRDA